MKIRIKWYLLPSVIALIAGFLIYLFYRAKKPLFLEWSGFIKINGANSPKVSSILHMPDPIIYSLPTGLWAFAYTLLISGIWSGSKSFMRYVWFVSIPLLVFGFELMQLTGNLSGTFSVRDILAGIVGIAAGLMIRYYSTKKYNHEKITCY